MSEPIEARVQPLTPTVGRIVHYVSYGTPGGEYPKACRAAVVTETYETRDTETDQVGLCVLNPTGQFFNRHVPNDPGGDPPDSQDGLPLCHGKDYEGGTWHWPEIKR